MIREIDWTLKWVNLWIGLRLIKEKNGVSSIESVIFFHGIVIGMIKQNLWTYKLVNFLIGLRGLRGINSKNGVSSKISDS